MEIETVERVYACEESPNLNIVANEGGTIKVVLNIVSTSPEAISSINHGGQVEVVVGRENKQVDGIKLPEGIYADASATLLYWIDRHPSMVGFLSEKAEKLGLEWDEILGYNPAGCLAPGDEAPPVE